MQQNSGGSMWHYLGSDQSSTIVFPSSIELIKPVLAAPVPLVRSMSLSEVALMATAGAEPDLARLPSDVHPGRVMVNSVPWPTTLRTSIVPPCACTMPRATLNPMPAPPVARSRDGSAR